ncbi:aminotransferase class III-fold pyridoxal phosphate-dependent enzyme [Elongatibacter sediminis]|uniref:Aminotransferase class III-fold pyridoxal phosphate-dependent enzyme n=1 Tax=Elongatibacter sediminis TaxID=3119006 RepID=A0AAW9RHR3_9GAMM
MSEAEYADLLRRREQALGPAYRLFYDDPVHLVRGEGVWLFDAEGRRYLDCYNNVASVGHCHPYVVEALARQAATLNTHTRYLHENVVAYAERLQATMPDELDTCMFVCTGTEANDLAFRIARMVTGQQGAIVAEDAYHGNSMVVTTLSTAEYPAADRPAWLATVEPPNPYRGTFRYGEEGLGPKYAGRAGEAITQLARAGHRPAMFMSCGIFDSNGALVPPEGYYREVFAQVRAAGGLCVADEVQSGLCRLGDHVWGYQDSGVVPDIVTLGKPIGDGHPLAAVVTTRDIAAAFARKFSYFNTFGGNPVSAAVGLAVLDVIERENVLHRVHDMGRLLQPRLRGLMERHERVGDVRGKGLFWGIELVTDRATREPDRAAAGQVRDRLRQQGVLVGTTGPYGNVVKIRPPLVFAPEHAELLLDPLDAILASLG